jgi:hypothetical protein
VLAGRILMGDNAVKASRHRSIGSGVSRNDLSSVPRQQPG